MSPNKIHSSAIIDTRAELNNVTVGPGVIIEKNVKIESGTEICAGITLPKIVLSDSCRKTCISTLQLKAV